MPGLDLLDAFIGLIFVFLTLSLIVTAVGEGITGLLGTRGKMLRHSLERLVGSHTSKLIIARPRFKALISADGQWPSYLPDRLFADLLVEVHVGEGASDGEKSAAWFDQRLAGEPDVAGLGIEDERRQVAELRETLRAMWRRAGYDVERFRLEVSQWFNDTQDRTSGWFKRQLGMQLFGIGLVVAVALNADTIFIFRTLTDNDALRAEFVDRALNHVRESKVPTDLESVCKELRGEAGAGTDAGADAECTPLDIAKYQSANVLPLVGWEKNHPTARALLAIGPGFAFAQFMTLMLALLGWLLTAAALSLGAPFWFDLLQRIVKIRGSLVPAAVPAASPAAAPGKPAAAPADGEAPAGGASPATAEPAADLQSFASFRHDSLRLDRVNAVWLGRLADLAYQDGATVTAQTEDWGLEGALHSASTGGDTQFILAETPHAIVVAYRGTEPKKLADVWTDVQLEQKVPSWKSGIEVHEGFLEALDGSWDALAAPLEALLAARARPVFLCGHSLGGALAVLAAARLVAEGVGAHTVMVGGVYTCGQPRVGGPAFAEWLEHALPGRVNRAVNNRDVVPLMPPPRLKVMVGGRGVDVDYRHFGTVLYFNDFGQLLVDPPLWYRALDKVAIGTADEMRDRLAETVGDHSMTDYVRLLARAAGGTT